MATVTFPAGRNRAFTGNDTLLFGIIFGILGFWLFAQTTLNISPVMAADLGIETNVMNIAVSITALFSGIFIVVIGGLADRFGRVRIVMLGLGFSIAGSLLVGMAPAGALAETILMLGRTLQGLAGAFIMPASLALIKAFWDGADRQRAISLFSMGTWGGSGFAALFGGHDGHTTMLLAAGKYLAETKNFNGTVRLIFQPGEETMQGGPAMIDDGLFERFPIDEVFAMHNMPGLGTGKFYFTDGETMAAVDNWEIELVGKGAHGAMPELSIDPVVAGSALVMSLQTIVARNVSPKNSAVVTVGAFLAGNAGNVVANSATLRLSIRTRTDEDRALVLGKVRALTQAHAEGYGCTYTIREGVPGAVLVNDSEETARAAQIARETFGAEHVVYPGPTFLASEDFAFMLEQRKGTYCFLGNGDTPMVHHPQYTFNTDMLPKGAAYWVALAENYLR